MLAVGPRMHVDLLHQLRVDPEHALRAVAGALEVLPRAVDDHRDAAEILQAADVDAGAGALGVGLQGDARHAEEDVERRRRHAPVELLLVDMADRGQRLDRRLAGAADDCDLVKQRGAVLLAGSTGCSSCWAAGCSRRVLGAGRCRIQRDHRDAGQQRRHPARYNRPRRDRQRTPALLSPSHPPTISPIAPTPIVSCGLA